MLSLFLAAALAQAAPPVASAVPDLREQWEALYLGANKSGHTRIAFDRVEADGKPVIRAETAMEMKLPRFGDTARMGMDATLYETISGRCYAFDYTLRQPGQDQVTSGRLDADGKMVVTLTTGGKENSQVMDWPDDVRGAAAIDRLTRAFALGTAAEATFVAFVPGTNQIADCVLKRKGKRPVKLADGTERELLEIATEQFARPKAQKLPVSVSWHDERGLAVKTEVSLFGMMTMTSYAAPKAAALAEGKSAPVAAAQDIGFGMLVPCPAVPNVRTAKSVTYQLQMGDADAAKAILDFAAQKVTARQGTALTLQALRRVPAPGAQPGPAAAEFLASNGFIQSEDAEVAALAKQVAGAEPDAWKKCQRLERWVKTEMKHGDFSVAFQTAGEALRQRRGDCTEHGVLLAALCRAAGVPARIAVGLVYVEGGQQASLGYHLWTEANLGGEWYALDGTLGDGAVGGDRIKLADSSLKGASALGTFMPVFDVMGKLKVVAATPAP